jgi:hypothetical protein
MRVKIVDDAAGDVGKQIEAPPPTKRFWVEKTIVQGLPIA